MNERETIEDLVRSTLDARSAGLDPASAARLRQAREAALAARRPVSGDHVGAARWLLPAGALAASLLVVIGLSLWLLVEPPRPGGEAVAAGDLILVEFAEADVDIELLEEIEFYDWLSLLAAVEDPA